MSAGTLFNKYNTPINMCSDFIPSGIDVVTEVLS